MAGLTGLLLLVSFVSWYRLKNMKLAIVGLAFLVFFVKALLLVFEIIVQDEKAIIIDFIVVILLYFAVVKK